MEIQSNIYFIFHFFYFQPFTFLSVPKIYSLVKTTVYNFRESKLKNMKSTQLKYLFVILSGIFFVSSNFAQTPETNVVVDPATVSGKVSVEGKAAANVLIAIVKASARYNEKPQATARTDADGKFSLEAIPAGSYHLRPEIPGFVFGEESDGKSFSYGGKALILEAGENLKNINIKLVRGAAITGRLINAQGRPLISEQIRLETYNEKGEKKFAPFDVFSGMGLTDDLGVYRFYGLKAGKYLVSFGLSAINGGIYESNGVTKKFYYPLVYYSSASSEKDAKIVELNVGETAENVDLRTDKKSRTFGISGTLINEETGKPFEKSNGLVSAVPRGEKSDFGYARGSVREDGSFDLKGFLPGRYILKIRFLFEEDKTDFYSPQTEFEIENDDLENLKIYAKKGLSLSGVCVLENKTQANIPVSLSNISLMLFGDQFNIAEKITSYREIKINADGTFRFAGLEFGEVRLSLRSNVFGVKIKKIEKNGVPLEKINLLAGKPLKDLLVTIRYGTNRLGGEVRFENGGEIPADSEIRLIAKPSERGRLDKSFAVADERGKFLLEGLTAEQYNVQVFLTNKRDNRNDPPGKLLAETQITLVGDGEAQTIFEVDLNK